MIRSIHDTSVQVNIFPDEFKPLIKAIKFTLLCKDADKHFTKEEWGTIHGLGSYLASIEHEMSV